MTDDMTDAMVAKLEAAGLVETCETADGKTAICLTRKGDQLGWLMAMASEDEAAVVLDALLADATGGRGSPSGIADPAVRRR
jgi:hypothetical protein